MDIDRYHRREKLGEKQGEVFLVSAFALLCSVIAFVWFYRRGDILLYGDAISHLNIARRLTDSRDAGWKQIGSVWLPLPHLLAAPFVANDWLWRTGIGGSIPSMGGYVLGVAGIYRLVRARASAAGASLAAAIYGLNPSLLYMQSTAMTESIFLAAVVWAVVYFDDFLRGLQGDPARSDNATLPAAGARAGKAIERCGICLAAAIFTRYDGWIIAFVVGVCAGVAALRWLSRRPPQPEKGRADNAAQPAAGARSGNARLVRSMAGFLLLLALCPALWLAHNYEVNRRPLDWLNGPYSAKAIERRSSRPGDPPYPGKGNAMVAAQYFLKAARMNTGEGGRENWLLWMALGGVMVAVFQLRRFAALPLLWIPLPFYAYSIGYGSVPIFVPEWWPFSYYNVRYGLELLPAIAVFAGLIPWAVSEMAARRAGAESGNATLPAAGARAGAESGNATLPAAGVRAGARHRGLTLAVTCALLAVTLLAYSSSAWCFSRRSQDRDWGRRWMIPICYREAWANSRGRMALEAQVGAALWAIPPNSTVLMYTSDYVGALQRAGIHFDHVISESTFIAWDSARSAPFAGADYIVAIAGDPVDEAVRINPRGLTKLEILHTMGKPDVTIYRGSRP